MTLPALVLPIDCKQGDTCWIVNFIDTDKADGSAKDHRCGPLTYDTHDGIDFAIRDLLAMEKGVNVLAAAPGKVLRIRNGAEDTMPSPEDIKTMIAERRGCGNGVVLEHGNGWKTVYCHMKKDSIRVQEGQGVTAGTLLGQVGHSGIAEFPHLHFAVFSGDKIIDPFTGQTPEAGCGIAGSPLWSHPPAYEPLSIYAAGFGTAAPSFEAIKVDTTSPAQIEAQETKILSFWAAFYGVSAGDRIKLEIIGPEGQTFASRELVQEKTRARQYFFIGKKTEKIRLKPGIYTGQVTITRDVAGGKPEVRTLEKAVSVF